MKKDKQVVRNRERETGKSWQKIQQEKFEVVIIIKYPQFELVAVKTVNYLIIGLQRTRLL